MEEIILKIQKLLATSKSPNENEAHSAMMLAQKLLIKYKLCQREVENFEIEDYKIIDSSSGVKFRGSSWKVNLARVIANNFGCYFFLRTKISNQVCFFGKEEDVTICNIILDYAVKCINADGDKLVKKLKEDKRRKYFDSIKDDYALGFIKGLDERFKEQIKNNEEWGLILSKDKNVTDKYNEFIADSETVKVHKTFNRHEGAYKAGKKDGKNFDITNKIECKEQDKLLIGT